MFFQNFCNVCNDSNIFNNILFACCLISTIFYWFSLGFKDIKILSTVAKISSRFATLSLFVFLLNRWVQFGYFPLSNLYESLLFLSCILLFVYQALESKTQSSLFGCIIVPIVLFITGFAALTLPLEMQKASALVPALQSNWLMMHVSLMMLSYAILIIGSSFAIVYVGAFLELEDYIKTIPVRAAEYEKHMRKTLNLTKSQFLYLGLDVIYNEEEDIVINNRTKFLYHIDNWSYRAISLGFPFLTIGIIAGAVWANEAWGSYWSWDPKETWALITWLIFAAYLHLRLIVGLNGKKPALLASIGFFVVWICYLGVNFLGQGLHSYGWFT
uniref:Cytochrome c biogenesis protein CcsA n=1 Tax=Costaria costata TaxID=2872 RepID=A0A0S0FBA1_COSCS|nr:cytochrome c biogenesis protein [Costaria costata]ALF62945.1 cytochrome c biogenesis protein [Costaria costata]QWK43819.1 cytochrome biogenesis protein [Costaria costata]WAM62484.1 Cytochrome c biogenesis protein [Costaria costata]